MAKQKAEEAAAVQTEEVASEGSLLDQILTEGRLARDEFQKEQAKDMIAEFVGQVMAGQLTMSKNNVSVTCGAGEPVLGQAYRIPVDEGAVKFQIFFSDQRLEAGSVANQLNEQSLRSFNPIDFRLPGKVVVETIDFIPSESNEPAPGKLVPGPSAPAAENRQG